MRSVVDAESLKKNLEWVARAFNLEVNVIFSDGSQPVGRGIGPALEARDILAVLNCDQEAPHDLRHRALSLAGHVLEFSPSVPAGQGRVIATGILDSGKALAKFQAICNAQGGMRDIKTAPFIHTIESSQSGKIINIDNRHLSRLAKLAGAPKSKLAGVELLAHLHTIVSKSQPLFNLHAETQGELNYALDFLTREHEIFQIEASS